MKTHGVGRATRGSQEIQRVEALLQASLQPVQPRPQFVKDLNARLMAKPEMILLAQPKKQSPKWGWTAFGVLSGAVILLLGARAIWTLVEMLSGQKQLLAQRRDTGLTPAGT